MPENWNLGRCVSLIWEGMGPGVLPMYVVCITLTSINSCAKSLFIQFQTRSCNAASVGRRTLPRRQLKVGKAQLWITHRRGNSYGLAVGRVRWYLRLFWERWFSTQIKRRCQKKVRQIVMARWNQKAISLGKLVLVTHAKAVQLVVYNSSLGGFTNWPIENWKGWKRGARRRLGWVLYNRQ